MRQYTYATMMPNIDLVHHSVHAYCITNKLNKASKYYDNYLLRQYINKNQQYDYNIYIYIYIQPKQNKLA